MGRSYKVDRRRDWVRMAVEAGAPAGLYQLQIGYPAEVSIRGSKRTV